VNPAMQQRLAALDRANQVRSSRAVVRRQLERGELHIADVLMRPPSCVRGYPVGKLLAHPPGMGAVKLRKALAALHLTPSLPVATLSARRRMAIVNYFRDECPSLWRKWGLHS